MANRQVVIVDYGMGNLWSVASAINFLDHTAIISDDPKIISKSSALILPGVGSFRRAMQTIRANAIDVAIFESLQSPNSKILGICLGMQLLGSSSTEDGMTDGLGLVKNKVTKLAFNHEQALKIPHVGFNQVDHDIQMTMFDQIEAKSSFYFVHSFVMEILNDESRYATTTYGQKFVAAIESSQVFGTQFHPEKSQRNGLDLLANFLR